MDNEGHEHLAVTGEERETRDGHYIYSAQEPLATLHPLQSSNMAGVTAWLEKVPFVPRTSPPPLHNTSNTCMGCLNFKSPFITSWAAVWLALLLA